MTRTALLVLILLVSMVAPLWAAEFDHNAHVTEFVGDDCTVCHVSTAETIAPKVSVCLDCHEQEDVDAAQFPARMTHGPLWALDHGPAATGTAANCTSCHQQNDCLDCHKSGFAHEQGSYTNSLSNVHGSDFHVSHPLAARADSNRCYSCHETRFCSDCHDDWRFSSGDIGSPSHRRTFDLGLEGTDIDMIHAGFNNTLACDSCHSGATMSFHDWSVGHAREARKSLASCQACHPDGDVCLRCHSARGGAYGFNPHPEDWDKIKDNISDVTNGRTCRKCH